ncbi:MAG: AIR synthase related protein, partial [Solirubrobacterales bacterium]
ERMLAIVEPARVDRVREVCEKWQTGFAAIGQVTTSGNFTVVADGEAVGEMAVEDLVDGCPAYDLEPAEPTEWPYSNDPSLDPGAESGEALIALLSSPTIASKRWAFEQYDSIVGSRTVVRPGPADAAVLSIPEAGTAIAVAIDGSGRRVACEPWSGTVGTVLECAANLACVGAEPLGLTNCLNFGNPEKPAIAWQLTRSVEGLADACGALGVPVVGGNVSLYNETPSGPIYPTPVVGMVGEVPDPSKVASRPWEEGDQVALVGPFDPSLAGSALAALTGSLGPGLPDPDLEGSIAAIELVRDAVRSGSVRTAHDISDGGIAVALAELALLAEVGCEADLGPVIARTDCSPDDALFGEGPGGFILAGEHSVLEQLGGKGVPVEMLGPVAGDELRVAAGERMVALGLGELREAWESLLAAVEA